VSAAVRQIRDEMTEHIIRRLVEAVVSDPCSVAFNRAPDIFGRTRDGVVFIYRPDDRPNVLGTGRVCRPGRKGTEEELNFSIRPSESADDLVHIDEGGALTLDAAARYLVDQVFLSKKARRAVP
jgi:hypothetical protein